MDIQKQIKKLELRLAALKAAKKTVKFSRDMIGRMAEVVGADGAAVITHKRVFTLDGWKTRCNGAGHLVVLRKARAVKERAAKASKAQAGTPAAAQERLAHRVAA